MVILQIVIRFLLAEVVDIVHNIHIGTLETEAKSKRLV